MSSVNLFEKDIYEVIFSSSDQLSTCSGIFIAKHEDLFAVEVLLASGITTLINFNDILEIKKVDPTNTTITEETFKILKTFTDNLKFFNY